MKSIKIVFALLFVKYSKCDVCQYNFTITDIDRTVLDEVKSFIQNGLIKCFPAVFDTKNVNFWLYTRENPWGAQINSNFPTIKQRKTIILIPGWLCNVNNNLAPELKDAYLQRYEANVITVDWSYYAAKTYGEAYCYAPEIAKAIAKFLLKLDVYLKISIESIHIVGHSMGGQLAGLAGHHLRTVYNKVLYRITGLDPAGPLYSKDSANNRLDKSDAYFVDVIHTNSGILGYELRCGHVDFYPGCGVSQNGCPFNLMSVLSVDFLVQKFNCDHLRSIDFMIESINHNNFVAKPKGLLCDSTGFETSYMGEDSILKFQDSSYVLFTNPRKPYGQG